MNVWMKRGLQVGLFTGGLWLVGTGIASADTTHPAPHHRAGPLAYVGVDAPIDVSGNSIAVLGRAGSPAAQTHEPAAQPAAGHHRSIAKVPAHAPVTVRGNSIAVLGHTRTEPATHTSADGAKPHSSTPTRRTSLVSAPVHAPVTACGNAVGVLGSSAAQCATDSGPAPSAGSRQATTDAVRVPVNAPVTVCGNPAGVLGRSAARCDQQPVAGGTGGSGDTGGSGGIIGVPVSAPVTVCGNGVGLLTGAAASCGGDDGTSTVSTFPTGDEPSGDEPSGGNGTGPGTDGSVDAVDSRVAAGVDPATIASSARTGLADTGAVRSRALASTGLDTQLLLGAAVLLLLAGLGLAVGPRRRSA